MKEVRIALYARVSTSNGQQTTETQLLQLRQYCERRGWENVVEYVDNGISGTKASRPQLDQLMKDAGRRQFDVVVVWKLDRFGRSIRQLVNDVTTIGELGIAFVSVTEGFDMTTAAGRMQFGIFSTFAEFERSLIVERVKSGLARAKSQGRVPGFKRQVLDLDGIRSRMAAGESMRACARSFAISPALLSKRLREVAA
jgi:DNA invertase Pin-like site-specific DNA recombinase